MIRRYIISLALVALLFIIPGCGGGGGGSNSNTNAPVKATITVNPEEVSVTDGTASIDTTSQFFYIVVKNENGIPYDEVEITISYLWAVPNKNALVQFYDGDDKVDSPMTVETDSNGTYKLRMDFKSGGGLAYSGNLQVSSGSVFGSASFEVKTD